MRSIFHHGRRCLWDFVRYNRLCGRLASWGLALLAALSGRPLRRIALLARAVRVCPTRRRLLHLKPALERDLDRVGPGPVGWQEIYPGWRAGAELPKGLILKPPVSRLEKGVLF